MEEVLKLESAPTKAVLSLGNLKHALKMVGMAIERTAAIPVLQCVRIEQTPAGLALEATNLELSIRAVIAETGGPEKPLVIQAEKFTAWTKSLTGDSVKLSATDHRATMQCGRSRAVLPVLPVANWPAGSLFDAALWANRITLTQGDLARALRFALIAMSTEQSRYTLNGIMASGDGNKLQLVATDGHRLMVYTLPSSEKLNLMLPGSLVKALLPLLDDEDGGIELSHNERAILTSIDGEDMAVHVASRKLTGIFPNWTAVYPKDKRTQVTVKAADMLASLERCALLSDERSGCVRLIFDDQITITASSPMNGEANETVECNGHPEAPLTIGVNGPYISGLLKKLDGDVTIALPMDGKSSLLFTATPHDGETLGYVVMPMRV